MQPSTFGLLLEILGEIFSENEQHSEVLKVIARCLASTTEHETWARDLILDELQKSDSEISEEDLEIVGLKPPFRLPYEHLVEILLSHSGELPELDHLMAVKFSDPSITDKICWRIISEPERFAASRYKKKISRMALRLKGGRGRAEGGGRGEEADGVELLANCYNGSKKMTKFFWELLNQPDTRILKCFGQIFRKKAETRDEYLFRLIYEFISIREAEKNPKKMEFCMQLLEFYELIPGSETSDALALALFENFPEISVVEFLVERKFLLPKMFELLRVTMEDDSSEEGINRIVNIFTKILTPASCRNHWRYFLKFTEQFPSSQLTTWDAVLGEVFHAFLKREYHLWIPQFRRRASKISKTLFSPIRLCLTSENSTERALEFIAEFIPGILPNHLSSLSFSRLEWPQNIYGIIYACEIYLQAAKTRALSAESSLKLKFSKPDIGFLPGEILADIFRKTQDHGLILASRTCARWHFYATNEIAVRWRGLYENLQDTLVAAIATDTIPLNTLRKKLQEPIFGTPKIVGALVSLPSVPFSCLQKLVNSEMEINLELLSERVIRALRGTRAGKEKDLAAALEVVVKTDLLAFRDPELCAAVFEYLETGSEISEEVLCQIFRYEFPEFLSVAVQMILSKFQAGVCCRVLIEHMEKTYPGSETRIFLALSESTAIWWGKPISLHSLEDLLRVYEKSEVPESVAYETFHQIVKGYAHPDSEKIFGPAFEILIGLDLDKVKKDAVCQTLKKICFSRDDGIEFPMRAIFDYGFLRPETRFSFISDLLSESRSERLQGVLGLMIRQLRENYFPGSDLLTPMKHVITGDFEALSPADFDILAEIPEFHSLIPDIASLIRIRMTAGFGVKKRPDPAFFHFVRTYAPASECLGYITRALETKAHSVTTILNFLEELFTCHAVKPKLVLPEIEKLMVSVLRNPSGELSLREKSVIKCSEKRSEFPISAGLFRKIGEAFAEDAKKYFKEIPSFDRAHSLGFEEYCSAWIEIGKTNFRGILLRQMEELIRAGKTRECELLDFLTGRYLELRKEEEAWAEAEKESDGSEHQEDARRERPKIEGWRMWVVSLMGASSRARKEVKKMDVRDLLEVFEDFCGGKGDPGLCKNKSMGRLWLKLVRRLAPGGGSESEEQEGFQEPHAGLRLSVACLCSKKFLEICHVTETTVGILEGSGTLFFYTTKFTLGLKYSQDEIDQFLRNVNFFVRPWTLRQELKVDEKRTERFLQKILMIPQA
jgi:hypothetical protein